MSLEEFRSFLAWCSVINIGILLFWAIMYLYAYSFIHRIHGQLFRLSSEQVDKLHVYTMAYYKMGIFLFNIVPYLALRII